MLRSKWTDFYERFVRFFGTIFFIARAKAALLLAPIVFAVSKNRADSSGSSCVGLGFLLTFPPIAMRLLIEQLSYTLTADRARRAIDCRLVARH